MAKKNIPTFPIEVRAGSASVKIYRVIKSDAKVFYQIRYYDGSNKRQTLTRSDLGKAKAEAQRIAVLISNGTAQGAPLSVEDRVAFERASTRAREIGLPLDAIISEYQQAVAKLPEDASLMEAVDYFMRHGAARIEHKEISAVVEEWKHQLDSDGKSDRYREDISHRMGKFATSFSGPIDAVTTRELQAWLNGLDVAGRTKNNFRRCLVSLFVFARDLGYLSPDIKTAANGLKKAKEQSGDIGILTVAMMKSLLKSADERLALYLAIGGFAGLRSAEILQLHWDEIDLKEGYIEVTAGKAKTAQRRIVPIQANLKKWIAPAQKKRGPIFPNEEVHTDRRTLVKELKMTWPNNALRHSYASYRMAMLKDAAGLADEMGNSPQMIYRNYRSVVRPKDASNWFKIEPAVN